MRPGLKSPVFNANIWNGAMTSVAMQTSSRVNPIRIEPIIPQPNSTVRGRR
jgi:hypothetical protein